MLHNTSLDLGTQRVKPSIKGTDGRPVLFVIVIFVAFLSDVGTIEMLRIPSTCRDNLIAVVHAIPLEQVVLVATHPCSSLSKHAIQSPYSILHFTSLIVETSLTLGGSPQTFKAISADPEAL